MLLSDVRKVESKQQLDVILDQLNEWSKFDFWCEDFDNYIKSHFNRNWMTIWEYIKYYGPLAEINYFLANEYGIRIVYKVDDYNKLVPNSFYAIKDVYDYYNFDTDLLGLNDK